MKKIRVIIAGFGNVGRGVMASIANNPDMELAGIASRSPERVKKELGETVPVVALADVEKWSKTLSPDVVILCGGSKSDLPQQGPELCRYVNTVDSFDNHSRIPEYFKAMDEAAQKGGNVAVISTGWDPGIFSLERVLGNSFIPGARAYGFYGMGPAGGLSMGHSDALRTIKGVKDARQFTHAIPGAVEKVRKGENPALTAGDMHSREWFVVLEEGADPAEVTKAIVEMPGYFEPYDTTVNFISQEELDANYKGFPHDGIVITAGTTGTGEKHPALAEYRCVWGSNPEATANVLVAHARAAARMAQEGRKGAFTILDIPASYFSTLSREELLKNWM
ncbi:MAG: diaminopimelate dehydrogenase [Lentisphaeria bacterium]|nr:diaminopimelate dehydrogenase [Lentisphaeria bacterium]